MIEMKFRAWDKINKRMIRVVGNIYLFKAFSRKHEGYTVMQSSGVKDKNKEEIYDGDIVVLSWNDENGYNKEIEEVINKGVYGFNPFSSPSYEIDKAYVYDFSENEIKIEVVGNIYENKEILEEK